jgi:hypothetical protein
MMSKPAHDDEPADSEPLSGPRRAGRSQPDRPNRSPVRPWRTGVRRPLWRTLLSALAGGGLTVAGLAGPLATGAGAESTSTTGTTGTTTTPATTTTEKAPETSTTTTSTSTTPSTETQSSTTPSTETQSSTTPSSTTPSDTTPTAETPSGTTPSSTTPATTTQGSSPGASAPGSQKGSSKHSNHGSGEPPLVLVRHKQNPSSKSNSPASSNQTSTKSKSKSGTKSGAGSKSSKAASEQAAAEALGSNKVALPPQLVAGEANALAAELAGTAASAQALDFYRIPLFLLPIYQAAAAQYGVPWQILAAINEIETDYGTDLSISSAGAEGWMQFMPSTWLEWGVDALNAGYADPYNPVDAIFAAARYLSAAGAAQNLDTAIFAYNHSEAYVSSVLLRAQLIASYPDQVIATLTGLVDDGLPVTGRLMGWEPPAAGATLPSSSSATAGATATTQGASSTSGTTSAGTTSSSATPGSSPAPPPGSVGSATATVASGPQFATLISEPNADAVAVQDGVVVKLGQTRKLGNYVQLRDVYGDIFTYAGLGSVAHSYTISPTEAAEDAAKPADPPGGAPTSSASATVTGKVRAFAHPGNPDALVATHAKTSRKSASDSRVRPLRPGAIVAQGTVLGSVNTAVGAQQGSIRFAIQPVGDAATIDPTAILSSWNQLHAALHPQGVKGTPSLRGATASGALVMSKPALEREVLSDPGIAMSACSRQEVAGGKIDKRALAVLAYLSRNGLKPTVGTLPCGNGAYAESGYVYPGHSGDAIAIVAINGIPIAGHQGARSITDTTVRTLLALPRKFSPARIVSLMQYPSAPNTVARADHSGYIEVVFALAAKHQSAGSKAARAALARSSAGVIGELNATQWEQLISRAAALPAPNVATKPSSRAIPDPKGSQGAESPSG